MEGLAFIAGLLTMGILWFITDISYNSPYGRGYRDGYFEAVEALLKKPEEESE